MIKTIKEIIPVIYAYTTPEIARHDGYTKIGDTGRETGKRLDEQMLTSDVHYNLEWELNAIYEGTNETFRDKDFHAYMQKQGIERLKGKNHKGKEVFLEWFKIKPQDAKMMLYDFRAYLLEKGVNTVNHFCSSNGKSIGDEWCEIDPVITRKYFDEFRHKPSILDNKKERN